MENDSPRSPPPANPISPQAQAQQEGGGGGGGGCGPHSSSLEEIIWVHVSPTTGGEFFLSVEPDMTVENFKRMISKRLKVPRDRICLLFRDKQLQEGSLVQHGITMGSRVTLLPNVETGLITQRPEVGIMQALESLNDTQVNEFLCGKAPLNLSMRLGDHMMLIQLQLSTVATSTLSSLGDAAAAAGSSSTSRAQTVAQDSPQSPPVSPSSGNYGQQQQQQSATPQPQPPSTTTAAASSPLTSSTTTSNSSNRGGSNSPPSLLQASRNLQHTLRRLSADVFSGREQGRRESVYSGTFSGALNPALQDPKGRPRRDVATIVHILNDLLCSVPEFRRVSSTTAGGTTTTTTTTTTTNSHNNNNNSHNTDNLDNNNCTTSTTGHYCKTNNNNSNVRMNGSSTLAGSAEQMLHQQQSRSSNNNTSSNSTTSLLPLPMDDGSERDDEEEEPPPDLPTTLDDSSTSHEDQNLRTRGKLEQLRLVMGERRERRLKRKRKPYQLPSSTDHTAPADHSVTA